MSVYLLISNEPSGRLGPAVVKHLVASEFKVTLLTRDPAKLVSTKFPSEVEVVKANYTSVSTLAPALRGHDAVVDLTNRTATEVQLLVIDATIAAQVPRLIPSCFGIGTTHPIVRSLPHIAGKIKIQDYYEQKAREGALTFSAIQTGIFLELALQGGRIISLSDEQLTTLFDGGDRPLSSTSIDSIGQAVAAALTKPEETKNRFLCVQNAILTQNKLLLLAKELAPQRPWAVAHRDTAEMERASWEAWNSGDRTPRATAGFFVRAGFGDGGVGAFEKLDNDLLMVKEYSDAELKNFLASFISA